MRYIGMGVTMATKYLNSGLCRNRAVEMILVVSKWLISSILEDIGEIPYQPGPSFTIVFQSNLLIRKGVQNFFLEILWFAKWPLLHHQGCI